jgi:hypothetical protein
MSTGPPTNTSAHPVRRGHAELAATVGSGVEGHAA